MDSLETGDLILFSNQSSGFFGIFTSMIKWGKHSNYSHTGIILRDPVFINPSLKGLSMFGNQVIMANLIHKIIK